LIRDTILAIAAEGGVVIVAHGASFALSDREDVLRVRVTASAETRQQRLTQQGLGEDMAVKAVKESDKDHKTYLKNFYGVSNEVPLDYDLILNTDRLSFENAVDAIVRVAG
jgi:cytidylate kinase